MATSIFAIIKQVIVTVSVASMIAFSAFADVLNIRDDAPETYVVQKGDTLWDISNIFLSKPWLWPELWRNNTQIENPHLIYPGDVLKLRYEDGVPVLEVVREKTSLMLTPDVQVRSKPAPIDVLPWDLLEPYILEGALMTQEEYELLPTVYGDSHGTPMFVQTDYVLSSNLISDSDDVMIVRKQRNVRDSFGKRIGIQVDTISDAKLRVETSGNQQVIELTHSHSEARQGDKIMPALESINNDLVLSAAEYQKGEIVENANGYNLIGNKDVVIINLGHVEVEPGMVFGIYEKGVDLKYSEADHTGRDTNFFNFMSFKRTIEQPAYKVGELIVFKTFEGGSYAFITEASTHLKGGEIIAAP